MLSRCMQCNCTETPAVHILLSVLTMERVDSRRTRLSALCQLLDNYTHFLGVLYQTTRKMYFLWKITGSLRTTSHKTVSVNYINSLYLENIPCKHTDATRQRAAHGGVRDAEQRHSPPFGCDKTMRSPQRRAHRRATKWCKETKFFRIRKQQTQYATHAQRRAHCRATKVFGIRMRRRQHAAHSGVRAAERR